MKRLTTYNPLILIILHAVGVVLFALDKSYASLSYFTLIITAILLMLDEPQLGKKITVFAIIFTFGFAVELIGVQTGWLFGDYEYGTSLGYKMWDVPVIIGLNWFVIVISSVSVVRKLKIKNRYIVAALSALLCTLLDVFIEPVAIRYDMWSWATAFIPIYNYVCWIVFSFFFALLHIRTSNQMNRTGTYLFFIWLIFFLLLNTI